MKKVIISLLASFTCALLLISCAKTTTTSPTAEVTTPTPSFTTNESQKYGGILRIIQDADMTNPGWPPDNGTMEDFYQRIPFLKPYGAMMKI